MQSSAAIFEGQPRPLCGSVLSWCRTAAWVVVAGAVTPAALAQLQPDSSAAPKSEAASEPPGGSAAEAASHSESDAPRAANTRRKAPSGVDAQLRRLSADLKLDAAQQAKIRPILVARNEQMQRLQHDTKLTPTLRRQQALAIGDRSAEQIRAQLTDAQRAQYIQPRATTVAQGVAPMRRSGMAAPAVTPANKGARP